MPLRPVNVATFALAGRGSCDYYGHYVAIGLASNTLPYVPARWRARMGLHDALPESGHDTLVRVTSHTHVVGCLVGDLMMAFRVLRHDGTTKVCEFVPGEQTA